MLRNINWGTTRMNIDGEWISHLCFADDVVLITDNIQEEQFMLDMLNDVFGKFGLKISISETQYRINLSLSKPLKVEKPEQVHLHE